MRSLSDFAKLDTPEKQIFLNATIFKERISIDYLKA